MKSFIRILIVIFLPITLIWFGFVLRNLWIDNTIKLRTEIPQSVFTKAQSDPEGFTRSFTLAFNFLARNDDYVSPEKSIPFKKVHPEQGDYDINSDGFTSLLEMEKVRRRAWITKDFYNSPYSLGGNVTWLMAFDTNRDKKVTRSEFEQALKEIIFEQCPFQKVSGDTKLVYLISEEGGQPSMVSVSGIADTTKVSNLHIPDSAPKMYIVATSREPVIWNITGNVDRIESFVAQGSRSTNRNIRLFNHANVGVVGIPEERVAFLGKRCLHNNMPYAYDPKTYGLERQLKMNKRLEYRLSKPVDIALSEFVLNEVSIPNGYILDTKTGNVDERRLKNRKIRSTWSREHFNIDLDKIASPTVPVKYDILPGKDGIKQLLESGKITKLGRESGAEVYKVNEEFSHYPTGLPWHSYIFVFNSGTKQPEFNPGFRNRVRPF